MKKLIYSFLIGLVVLSFQACTNQQSSNDTKDSLDSLNSEANVATTEDGSDFMMEAASGGMMEVELGRIAQDNSLNPRVKGFGKMMVDDHSKANDEMKSLAVSKNVTLPNSPTEDQMKEINDLKSKKGPEFDKAYMGMMVDDHKKDVDKFQDVSENSKDPDVKAFASKILPTLKVHLDSAKAINDKLK